MGIINSDPPAWDNDGGTGGTHEYNQSATQKTRKAMLGRDAAALRPGDREPTTYHARAQTDDDGLGGRFKSDDAVNVAPQWSKDAAALPPERPLGYDINEVPNIEACSWEGDAQGPDGQAERQARTAAALKAIPHEAEAKPSDAPTIQQGQTAERLRVRGLVKLAQEHAAPADDIPRPAEPVLSAGNAGASSPSPLRRR